MAEARELLAVRNLHALQEVSSLQASNSLLLNRTEEAEDSSRRDALTGVLNRTWLDRTLDREFTQAVVFGCDLSIAHVDLDHFRGINERHGTPVGDRVLRSCAHALQSCVRGSDLVARFSGEEFVVVLPGADPQIARQVADRMLNALATADHDPQTGSVRVTASIGVATYTTKHRFPSTLALLEAADHALYAAKLCGRNRVECFEEAADGAARAGRFLTDQFRERRFIMFAPQTIAATRLPRTRSRTGPSNAAVAAAPDGSTASFALRNRKRIAARSSSSVTRTSSSTLRRHNSNENGSA